MVIRRDERILQAMPEEALRDCRVRMSVRLSVRPVRWLH